jgi:hypothetical protein
MKFNQYVQKKDDKNSITVAYLKDFNKTKVLYNDLLLGTINSKTELETGQSFTLPNNTQIEVKLNKKRVIVMQSGKKLILSSKDLHSKLNGAFGAIIFIALVNIILSIILLFFNINEFNNLSPIGLFIFGLTFLILGRFVKKASFIALLLALILFIFDLVITIVDMISTGNASASTSGMFTFKLFLIYAMIQGLIVIPRIKKFEARIQNINY